MRKSDPFPTQSEWRRLKAKLQADGDLHPSLADKHPIWFCSHRDDPEVRKIIKREFDLDK